jgi:ABC-type lipoprotein export system ATPase subunit
MNEAVTMEGALIEAIDVHKSYRLGRRSIDVLGGVNLAIERGGFVAIQGASGAGKSTLLHLLGGLDQPSRGTIRFEGREVTRLSKPELAKFRNRRVGFVFQAYHLLPEFSALENVCLPARMNRQPAVQVVARARDLLERVGLGDRLDHRPYELSGGEQQRVAVARALINRPHLVLADEPTGNLDSHTGGEIIDLLVALRAELDTTLVIATHDGRVAARAPRIVELLDGRVDANHVDRPE